MKQFPYSFENYVAKKSIRDIKMCSLATIIDAHP